MRPTGDETRRSEVRRLGLLILIMILIVILPAPNCYGLSTLNSLALLCTRLHHFAVILKGLRPSVMLGRLVYIFLSLIFLSDVFSATAEEFYRGNSTPDPGPNSRVNQTKLNQIKPKIF